MSAHQALVEQMRAHRGVDPHAVLDGRQRSNRAMRRAAAKVVRTNPKPHDSEEATR